MTADGFDEVFAGKDQNSISLTIKNYGFPRGVSTLVHDAGSALKNIDGIFNMTGPTGKGLKISKSGIHIAFSAGTGSLVYLDLVSALLLRNRFKGTGKKIPEDLDEDQIDDDFKFHLYVSFQNQESSIGLDLCTKLMKMNKQFGIDNFKLTVRLSDGADDEIDEDSGVEYLKRRWNKDFIDERVSEHSGEIKRIWVCGPPIMNETFDKAFESIIIEKGDKLGLKPEMIDIM